MERDVAAGRREIAVIVPAAVALAGLAAFIAAYLCRLIRFFLQQLIERFFYAAADQFFDLPLDYFLVKLYNLLGHGLFSPFRMVCSIFILTESANRVFLFFQICATYSTLSPDGSGTGRGGGKYINCSLWKDGKTDMLPL